MSKSKCEQIDKWTNGQKDKWTKEPMDKPINGQMNDSQY